MLFLLFIIVFAITLIVLLSKKTDRADSVIQQELVKHEDEVLPVVLVEEVVETVVKAPKPSKSKTSKKKKKKK